MRWTVRPCAQPAQARIRHLISWRPWTRPRVLSLPRHVWQTSPMRSPRSGNCSSPLDLDGVVVSADAMHTQTDTAEWTRPAGRSLRAHASGRSEDPAQDTQEQDTQEAALTRTSRPPPGATSLTGGECGAPPEATWAPTWVDFPGAAQVVQVRRTRTTKDRRSTGKNGGGSVKRTTVEVVCPGLFPTHGTGSTRAGCRLGPGTLEDRQPAPRRSVTWSRARITTSCAPPTAPRTWPP